MGDPAGVGAEVILKALARQEIQDRCVPLVIGDEHVLRETAKLLNLPYDLTLVKDLDDQNLASCPGCIYQPESTQADFCPSKISKANGEVSCRYIEVAARLALSNQVHGICTAPISKEAIKLAGSYFPGHTEMLAKLCGNQSVRMMLVGGSLQVVLQTIHVALKDVPGLMSREAIAESLNIITDFAKRTGNENPRIAVCGLNPHAGEAGHFGREEIDVIAPAIEDAVASGIHAVGPLPGDTVFHRALEGEFDYVLAMYHDQALIPVKTLDFHGGVNVTIGLPIIRTSPDHGTAFGIAGKGLANEGSMVAALKFAAGLASRMIEAK